MIHQGLWSRQERRVARVQREYSFAGHRHVHPALASVRNGSITETFDIVAGDPAKIIIRRLYWSESNL